MEDNKICPEMENHPADPLIISGQKTENATQMKERLENSSHEEEREQWTTKVDFVLSVVGLCVGLGNVWRFPYLCYENGGGAFLVPYLLALIMGGIPLLLLELSVGQLWNIGGLGVWKLCPMFKGVGYAAIIMAFWLSIYYIVILAYAAYYIINSFQPTPLPWNTCSGDWNTKCCRTPYKRNETFDSLTKTASFKCMWANATFENGTSTKMMVPDFLFNNQQTKVNTSSLPLIDWLSAWQTSSNEIQSCQECPEWTNPESEYWINNLLQRSRGIDEPGQLRVSLALCLLAMWILVYFCLWKGVKWTGKVVYFTALFPYVLLIVFFILGLTLPGSGQGIRFYLKPDLSKLFGSTKIWLDATSQIFFSYGLGLGSHIALGSYNKKNNNCHRDALIVSCVNSGTSFFAGFVVFSFIGFMAHEQNTDIATVARSGPGLVFIVYPSGISQLPWAPMWCALFFIMIIIIGLDSQFCTLEGLITAIIDEWPHLFRQRRKWLVAAVCGVSYLIGLSTVTQGGIYVFRIFDHYSASGMALLFLIFFECIAFSWSLGITRFTQSIERMLGFKLAFWWKWCWVGFSPIICASVFLSSAIAYKEVEYENYVFPKWAHAMGWLIALSSISLIPAFMIYSVYKALVMEKEKPMKVRLMNLIRPEHLPEIEETTTVNAPLKEFENLELQNSHLSKIV